MVKSKKSTKSLHPTRYYSMNIASTVLDSMNIVSTILHYTNVSAFPCKSYSTEFSEVYSPCYSWFFKTEPWTITSYSWEFSQV